MLSKWPCQPQLWDPCILRWEPVCLSCSASLEVPWDCLFPYPTPKPPSHWVADSQRPPTTLQSCLQPNYVGLLWLQTASDFSHLVRIPGAGGFGFKSLRDSSTLSASEPHLSHYSTLWPFLELHTRKESWSREALGPADKEALGWEVLKNNIIDGDDDNDYDDESGRVKSLAYSHFQLTSSPQRGFPQQPYLK